MAYTCCGHSLLRKNGTTLNYYLRHFNLESGQLKAIDEFTAVLSKTNFVNVYNHIGKNIAEQATLLFGSGLKNSKFKYHPKAKLESAIVVENPILSNDVMKSFYRVDSTSTISSRNENFLC